MKIFPSSSIKKLDAYTIEHEPIASIDLMERAAQALTKAITNRWNPETPVTIFAGPGNNGGDRRHSPRTRSGATDYSLPASSTPSAEESLPL